MEKKIKTNVRNYGTVTFEAGTGYIDMNQQELKQAVIHVTTLPTSPVKGQAVYDSVNDNFKGWNGTAWITFGITDHGQLTGLSDDDHTQYTLVSGSRAFTGVVQGVVRSGGSLGADLVTYAQLEAARQGINGKESVRVATTANISLNGTQTIDGIALGIGDRVLVKNQTIPSQNGIYNVNSGGWVRAVDTDSWLELVSAFVFVEIGTMFADTGWLCTINDGGILNTNDITWVQFSSAGINTMANVGTLGTGVYAEKVGTEFKLSKLNGTGAVAISGGGPNTSIVVTGSNKINALNSLNVNGVVVQTGTDTFAGRTIVRSGTGVSVTNGDGVAGNPTILLDPDLDAIALLSGTGILERTGTETWQLLSAVPISRGGTAGTTAAQARTNLGVTGKYSAVYPPSQVAAGGYFDVSHNLGNACVDVTVWGYDGTNVTEIIEFYVARLSETTVRIHTSVMITVNSLLVVVVG